ncbi:MAG: helix-turn-helix domain-containing protein [Solirubrobacteraceae bacterium]|nr:helix-turn-helix domain-containing protein [Patulibacter sp.]
MPQLSPVHDREAARHRIHVAMAELVAERGYRRTHLPDVAKRGRVSLRTFYAEFANKEACFLEVHAVLVERVELGLREAVRFDGTPAEVTRRACERILGLLVVEPLLTHAAVVELATLSDVARKARDRSLARIASIVVDLVDEGRERFPDVPMRPLPLPVAVAILGSVVELVTRRTAQHGELAELAETTTDLLLSVITNVGGLDAAGVAEAQATPPAVAAAADR